MPKSLWWSRPSLRTDEEDERHRAVTWLELFFDLVFVVVIARLAHNLAGELSPHGFLVFVLMFIAVFWVWNGAVYYVERFESEGLEMRIFTFVVMVFVAGMATYSHHGLEENYRGFALSYLGARTVNIGLWLRAGLHVKRFRPISNRFGAGFLVTAGLIIGSFFVASPWHIVMWTVAILTDIVTPYFTMGLQAQLPRISTSKFPERFGLLTIIVLGESVVGVINGLSDYHHLTVETTLNGILGLFIGFSLWWIYFDFIARRPPKEHITTTLFWVYMHVFFLTAVTMTGVAITGLLGEELSGGVPGPFTALLLASVGLSILFIGGLEQTLSRSEDEPTHPLLSPLLKISAGVVLIALSFANLSHVTLALGLCILGLLPQKVYGIMAWFGKESEAS
ncbi:low temperature requirement protein A [Gemmatimonadota bacterium]